MAESSEVFERHYQTYCNQIAELNFDRIADKLGAIQENNRLRIRFYNQEYLVSKDGIFDPSGRKADYGTAVILAKYLLLCPEKDHIDLNWVAFKDFKSVSHFTNVNYFNSDTQHAIETHFSGRLPELRKAAQKLKGTAPEMALSYDLVMQFEALPRISLLLLFNDGDEEFPAKCTVLFQKHAEHYLDPESLAVTGAYLAKNLKAVCEPE